MPVAGIAAYNASNHMLTMDASYLRQRAEYCVALARRCSDLPTSQALEALGIELMEKAAELDQERSLFPATDGDRKAGFEDE